MLEQQKCMYCKWYRGYKGKCRIWGETPQFVVIQNQCTFYEHFDFSTVDDPPMPPKKIILKKTLIGMKALIDFAIKELV